MNTVLLESRDLVKVFPGVRALDGVGLRLTAGSVHALLGENGAGKSTLIKVLTGVHSPDGGALTWCGEPVQRSGRTALLIADRAHVERTTLR